MFPNILSFMRTLLGRLFQANSKLSKSSRQGRPITEKVRMCIFYKFVKPDE